MTERKIVLRTRLAAKKPPYQYAQVEIEKSIELHSPLEDSPELLAFEREAKQMKLSIRDKNGNLSLRRLDEAMTEFVIRRFLDAKDEIDNLPPSAWEFS